MQGDSQRPRTLIIGIDGATFDLIDPLIDAGHLPAFARIRKEGASGTLDSWPNMNSAASWTSIVTGCNPGQHGIYDFGDAPPQRGQVWRPTTAADRRKDPFWRVLTAAGQFAGVLNVPISYPSDRIGFMLSGMDTPTVESPGFAQPTDLMAELKQQGIDYVIDVQSLHESGRRDPDRMPPEVRRMVDARAQATLYLMEHRPWDVIMSVFIATDRMQHSYWPVSEEALAAPKAHPLRELYQQLDGFLTQVLERLDDRTTLLIVSDHGFGPMNHAVRSMNLLLSRTGLLRHKPGADPRSSPFFDAIVKLGRRWIPRQFQRNLAMALPALRLRVINKRKFPGVDWSGTKVFSDPSGERLWINLAGREPEGIVEPSDYDAVCDAVRSILMSLTDPGTGRTLVRGVIKRAELYHGPHVERAPDLAIHWDHAAVRDALRCEHHGEVVELRTPPETGAGAKWKGNHRPSGILMAYGARVRRGARVDAHVYDIAPTVYALQGHPLPEGLDGQVLTGLFTPEFATGGKTSASAAAAPGSATAAPGDQASPEAGHELDEQERQQLEQRLRDLGYID